MTDDFVLETALLMSNKWLSHAFLCGSAVAFLAATISGLLQNYLTMGILAILGCAGLGLFFQTKTALKTFSFTCWVLGFFFAALVFPACFQEIGGFHQKELIVPLLQVIMFGMGATLSLGDFGRALKMPKAVLLGMLLQFTVMPITGWTIAIAFGFDPEIAAGIVLIGCCSGGVASNVMVFLSKGNVALSVTMTACSTLVSPVVTPLAMELLAGAMIEISILKMMLSIVNLIILPIAAGLIAHYLLQSKVKATGWRLMSLAIGILCFFLGRQFPESQSHLLSLCGAAILIAMIQRNWLESALPILSMAAIGYIIAIIASLQRAEILTVGISLFSAALIHNLVGYSIGYTLARASRLSLADSRTVAFEVGMQNGGMGTALAMDVLKSASAALGPIIFSTWMNITGSILASYWKGRQPNDTPATKSAPP